jgi:hypothetical protein
VKVEAQVHFGGDFDTAERYGRMGWDLRSDQGHYKPVLKYQARVDHQTICGRRVRIYNLSFNELKSCFDACNSSNKSWWQFWK